MGGEKSRRDLGRWASLDIRPGAEYVINLNEFKRFPVKHVCAYYTSHTLEHLPPEGVKKVLNECYRTLMRGKKIRVVVPDIRVGVEWFIKEPSLLRGKHLPYKPVNYPDTVLGYLLAWFYTPDKGETNGHKMVFDWETLVYYLEDAGFRDIVKMKYNECSEVFFGKDIGRYKDFSIYAEAVK